MSSDVISYHCPGCHTVYSLPVQMANRWHECSKCRINNQVPAKSEVEVEGDEIANLWGSQPPASTEPRSRQPALSRRIIPPLNDHLIPDEQPLASDHSWVSDAEDLEPRRPQRSSRDRAPKATHRVQDETTQETDDVPRSRWQIVLKWAGWATGLTMTGLVAIWAYPPILLAVIVGYLLILFILLMAAWVLGFGHAWKNDKVSAMFFFIPPFLYFVRYIIRNWSETRLAGMALVAFLVLTIVPFAVAVPVMAVASIFQEAPVVVDAPDGGIDPRDQTPASDHVDQNSPHPVLPQPDKVADSDSDRALTPVTATEQPSLNTAPADPVVEPLPVPPVEATSPQGQPSTQIRPPYGNRSMRGSGSTRRSTVTRNGVVTETITDSQGRTSRTVRGASTPLDNEATQRGMSIRRKLSTLKIGDSITETVVGTQHGAIWGGKDGVYSDDSDPGTAAVHQGLLKVGESGRIKISVTPGIASYPKIAQNGVESMSWGSWDSSLMFELIKEAPESPSVPSLGADMD